MRKTWLALLAGLIVLAIAGTARPGREVLDSLIGKVLENYPELSAARSIQDAALSSSRAAGALPDPMLSVGVLNLSELRSLQDWFLKYELSAMPGVSEVASVGGFVRQYQVEVDPRKLEHYGIPLSHVLMAVKKSTGATGARALELGETEFMVRSQAYIGDLDDLRQLPVHTEHGDPPVLLSSIADIHLGPDIRRGVAELDGEGEAVGGIVIMRYGENA